MFTKIRFLLLFIAGGIGSLIVISNFSFAGSKNNDFHYTIPHTSQVMESQPNTEIGKIVTTDAVTQREGLLQRLMGALGLQKPADGEKQPALAYIKKIINYALGFVSFIAFVLVLYAFYMMLIGDGDKGREKVKSTLKGIAIAIIILSVAWLVVSMLFWIYQSQAAKI